MPLQWNKSLEIGVPKIDEQHKELIDAINKLLVSMKSGQDSRTLKNLTVDISSIVSRHFGYEEACMHRYKCPVATKNATLHSHFKNTVDAIYNELSVNGGSSMMYNRIEQEMLNWFANHIRGIDTQLKSYVN